MSVESAQAYIERMRSDPDFRQLMQADADDQAASWAKLAAQGYDFDMSDFRKAQALIYEAYGIEPL